MTSEPYLNPRLVGSRFDAHTIPLDILRDLAAIEELIVAVAKWRYLQSNKKRKRVPRGFSSGISLELQDVGEGSAIANIVLSIAATSLFPSDVHESFLEARDSVIAAIRAADKNTSISEHLPEKFFSYFDPIGRSLRDGEAIEFEVGQPTEARLTRDTRRKIVLSAQNPARVTDEITVVGAVAELDQADERFEIQLPDKRKITAPLPKGDIEILTDALRGYDTGVRIRLKGVAQFTHGNRLERFQSVERVSIIEPLDIFLRLQEFKALEDGWLDGEGVAPEQQHLDWLSQAFELYYFDDLKPPFLFPTIAGGVRAEWTLGDHEVSLEIDLSRQSGEWHDLNLKSDETGLENLDLRDENAWAWMMKKLRDLGGDAE